MADGRPVRRNHRTRVSQWETPERDTHPSRSGALLCWQTGCTADSGDWAREKNLRFRFHSTTSFDSILFRSWAVPSHKPRHGTREGSEHPTRVRYRQDEG